MLIDELVRRLGAAEVCRQLGVPVSTDLRQFAAQLDRRPQAAIAGGDIIMNMPDISPEQRREIERLVAEHGGELTEEIVLEAARSPDSYLHSLFEWDDAKAARKHRESWADEQRS